jgi:hypothetical protein
MRRTTPPAAGDCSWRSSPTKTTLQFASWARWGDPGEVEGAGHRRLVDDHEAADRELLVPPVGPGAGDVLDPATGLLGEDVGRVLRRSQPEHAASVTLGDLDDRTLGVGLASAGWTDQHRDPLCPAQDLLDAGGLVDAELDARQLGVHHRPRGRRGVGDVGGLDKNASAPVTSTVEYRSRCGSR